MIADMIVRQWLVVAMVLALLDEMGDL